MEDNLIALLETLKYPVIRQGSLSPSDPYPASFFTFWNGNEAGESYYDNDVALVEYDYNVFAYSTSPNTAYSMLAQARDLLKANGWVIVTRGFDAQSDEASHAGRGMSVTFLENTTIKEVQENA